MFISMMEEGAADGWQRMMLADFLGQRMAGSCWSWLGAADGWQRECWLVDSFYSSANKSLYPYENRDVIDKKEL
jgi:hypothetical protein